MQLDIRQGLNRRNALLARGIVRLLCRSLVPYQPVLLDGRRIAGGRRNSEERLTAILDTLAGCDARSMLDLGCAEGYFVRRCAEAGYLSIGVDVDVRRLLVAQWSATLDGVAGFGFIRTHLDAETISCLPDSDVTVSLSVFHHVMYGLGIDAARSQLQSVRSVTRKALVFEMGQSNEVAFSWASLLPDMGADPHSWIAEFLASAGFTQVRKVCETPAYNSPVPRATFVANP